MKRIAFFILAFLLIASPAYAGGIGSWFGGPTGGGGGTTSGGASFSSILNAVPSAPVDKYIYAADRVTWNPASLTTVTETASTVAFVAGSPATITDSGNGFVTAGFLPGQYIKVAGSASNNGAYQLAGVAAGTLTLISTQTLTAESAGASDTITGGAPYTVLYSVNGASGSAAWYAIQDTLGNLYVVPPANSQKQVVSPAYPNSTSPYVMQGLAGLITPARSGNVLILISGTITASNNTIAYGVQYQISYGTSTAPTSNSALAGTQVGTVQKYENQSSGITAADVFIPFSTHAVVTGLTVGTAYWIDLAAESLGAVSDVGFSNVSITVIEQ